MIDSSLGETEMKHLLLSQKKLDNTLKRVANSINHEIDRGKEPNGDLRKQFDNVVVLTLALNTVAADYANIYEGDPTFDIAYQAFKDKSDSLILYEQAITSLLQNK